MKLLLFIFLFNFGIFCYGFNQHRIINGTETTPGEYQNVVRIQRLLFIKDPGKNLLPRTGDSLLQLLINVCTGTIISDRHILTAAHCVTKEEEELPQYETFFIDHRPLAPNHSMWAKHENHFNISDYGTVNNFYFHEGWHWQDFQHDIGIIEFPVGTKLGEPVKLAKNFVEGSNDIGINVGYGVDASDATVAAQQLMQIYLPIWSKADCKANDAEHPVICAGNSTHQSDTGDSGPLFYDTSDGKRYQIGITHDGALKNGSADETHAETTAFIRVSAYCDWIEETTKGEAKCEEIKKTSTNPQAQTNEPDVSPNTDTKIAPIKELPEAQHDNNGSTSKNIFVILSTLFFVFVLKIAFIF